MNHHSQLIVRSIIALLISTTAATKAAEEIVAQDSFSLISGRASGEPLNGIACEKGGETWVAEEAILVDNCVRSSGRLSDWPYFEARLAIPEVKTTTTASIKVVTETTGWIGIGFYEDTNRNIFKSRLFVVLQPNGEWVVYSDYSDNPGSIRARGKLEGYSPENPVVLGLSFDPKTNRVRPFVREDSAEINLHEENGGWIDTNLPQRISLNAVGIRAHGYGPDGTEITQADRYFVDDFLVTRERK